ncbi:MAG: GDP-mannose 4,6-dehydratase, partial [Alphaproteobacteria bacterium]|nr:GDP-mannose 4,6-dehydratase [Alphaproteobacteria bacterium]
YDTRDGTGERDYIHVVDLAAAHLAALEYSARATGCEAINVGTGRGVTVKELVAAYERACGRPLPFEIAPRRPGDVASSYAATDKAERLLGWRATAAIDDMCTDSWCWQSFNLNGFSSD